MSTERKYMIGIEANNALSPFAQLQPYSSTDSSHNRLSKTKNNDYVSYLPQQLSMPFPNDNYSANSRHSLNTPINACLFINNSAPSSPTEKSSSLRKQSPINDRKRRSVAYGGAEEFNKAREQYRNSNIRGRATSRNYIITDINNDSFLSLSRKGSRRSSHQGSPLGDPLETNGTDVQSFTGIEGNGLGASPSNTSSRRGSNVSTNSISSGRGSKHHSRRNSTAIKFHHPIYVDKEDG